MLESCRRRIFDAIHELSHPSGKATLAIISKSYAWKNMCRDVLQWARQCQACAASKVTVHNPPAVQPIPVPTVRFGHVHLDIDRPFPTDQGFSHLLTVIDRTTRWPEAMPIANTSADTVLQAFLGAGCLGSAFQKRSPPTGEHNSCLVFGIRV